MTPVVNGLQNEFGNTITFVSLNANADGQTLFEALTLPGHPAIVIFDSQKQEIYRGFGILTEDILRDEIQALYSP